MKEHPRWTVVYNTISPENSKWIGTGWEFFDEEKDAQTCYDRHIKLGNCPTKRFYYQGIDPNKPKYDYFHLGAAHRM